MGRRATVLAWGLGVGLGAALGIGLGPRVPGWGMALAFPAAALVLCVGVLVEDDGDGLRHALRLMCALTIGFLLTNVPLTTIGLVELMESAAGDPELVARAAMVRASLFPRWVIVAMAAPACATTLWLRLRREQDRARAEAARGRAG